MKYFILFITFIFITTLSASQDYKLNISTGELPPYAYLKNNELSGLSVDIVKEIQKRVGYKYQIRNKPWGRVIKESHEPYSMTFPLARVPYREKLYKWIGPIYTDSFVFIVKKENYRNIKDINELKDISVGVNLGAPTTKRLKSLNFTDLIIITSEIKLSKMFIRDRFQAWYSPKLMIYDMLNRLDYNLDDTSILYKDKTINFYITTSLDVDDKIIKIWQNELDKMKEDGTFQKIIKKYEVK